MNFPFLTIIAFMPVLASVILFLMPDEGRMDPEKDAARIAALRTGVRSRRPVAREARVGRAFRSR